MSIYAIGDVQGCFKTLKSLLDEIQFHPEKDTLWFTGDLVNRGPNSLETLRYIKHLNLQGSAITVLGNHDLHLLALYYTPHHCQKERQYLEEVLAAPDAEELCTWLCQQPLLYQTKTNRHIITHAGIYPCWTLEEAQSYALEVEQALKGPEFKEFLIHMYGNTPTRWERKLTGYERLRFITHAFTRMRFCKFDGELDFEQTGDLNSAPHQLYAWFDLPNRTPINATIIFGHWAALQGKLKRDNLLAIDGGCVWGNDLIAIRLEDHVLFRKSKQD